MADVRKKLHDAAVAVSPKELGPFEFCVAILEIGKSLDGCQSSDFLWFKCRGKHSIKTIEDHYATRTSKEVHLKQGGFTPPPNAQIQQLNHFGDKIIVFIAVEGKDDQAVMARSPLEPVNIQAPLKSVNIAPSVNPADAALTAKSLRHDHHVRSSSTSSNPLTPAATTQSLKRETGLHFPHMKSIPPFTEASPQREEAWQPFHKISIGQSSAPRHVEHLHELLKADPAHSFAEKVGLAAAQPSAFHNHFIKKEKQHSASADGLSVFATAPVSSIVDPPAMTGAGKVPFEARLEVLKNRGRPESWSRAQADAAAEVLLQTYYDKQALAEFSKQPGPPMPVDFLAGLKVRGMLPERPEPSGFTPFINQEANQENISSESHSGLEQAVFSGKATNTQGLNSAQNDLLQKILKEGTPEDLEAEVQRDLLLLDQLKIPMAVLAAQDPEAQRWSQQIANLRNENLCQQTVIGVVGNTGAGKSSIINALLDEERLVPTNCMRACTATVSTLSWNDSEEENAKYRADVEFIQPEDWEKELRVLFAELLDGSGKISKEVYNADSEAGIAYAKIRVVYPQMTKDEIAKSSITQLMQHHAIERLLGTTRKIEEAHASSFYKRLQRYIDSQEKSTDESKKEKREMEFWPLIKVVKIFTKSDCLSSGAVIVDLPGVHDANAARAAVAQNYMKQCTGLFICAPINRAVDDKAAKSLLGESFKRQLKYDGTYSRVTFICSKTDDISITEASHSLGLGDKMSQKWETVDQIGRDQRRLKKKLMEYKESKSVFGDVLNDTDDQLEIWDKLKDDLEDGKTVYAPTKISKKRKRSEGKSKPRKKTSAESGSDVEGGSSTASEDESNLADSQQCTGDPLTEEAVDDKIAELKAMKKEARGQRREIDSQIQAVKDEITALEVTNAKIEAEMSAICISGRNNYSKGAIRQDFAAGIRELDQENAAEEDEGNFNPEEDIRDYEEVARSLPVFCVSSRAYQQMSGRLQRDKPVPGFTSLDETEIPQLQAHCKKLTEKGRAAACRRFLNSLSQLINSLTLWSSPDSSLNLTDSQMAAVGRFLKSKLAALETGLEKAVQDCLEEMKESLSENIYEKFDQVILAAVNEANATAYKWGAPVNRENRAAGGFYWATFKAVVRRNGVFANAQGVHDFNSQLTEPIMKQLASDWEKAFARRLPSVLANFTKRTQALLLSFHRDVETLAMERGAGIAGMSMLGQQLRTHDNIFQDLTAQMMEVVNAFQREANREFTPVIAQHLASAYSWCTAESGPGQFVRMKAHMNSHVDTHKQKMFLESTEEVKKRLTQMCRDIEEAMSNKADEVFNLMRRDYMTVITGAQMKRGAEMPKWQRLKMAEIAKIIDDIEAAATTELKGEKPDTLDEKPLDMNAMEAIADSSVARNERELDDDGSSKDGFGYQSAQEYSEEAC